MTFNLVFGLVNITLLLELHGESISDFSLELKKLVAQCEFDCSCGKSTADTLLRLQFIRRRSDSEISTKLLQTNYDTTFQEVENFEINS